jgi:UDP-glucose 4-epimerase
MTNYFISGCAGFISSHLLDKLLEDKSNKVIGYDNLYRGRMINIEHNLSNENFSFIYGDIRNYEMLSAYLEGSDICFHLAAQSNVVGSMNNPDYCFETNVIGTYNILKACKERKVNKIVFSSSREVYGDAQYIPVDENHPLNAKNVYGASKIAGEAYCRTFEKLYGMDISVLRFSNVYGKRDYDRVIPIFLNDIKQNKSIKVYGGDQILDFIPVSYVVDALIKASKINLNGLPVNVGSGQRTNILDLANLMKLLSNKNIEIIIDPARKFEINNFVANTVRMKDMLGIKPPMSPLHYISEMIQERI